MEVICLSSVIDDSLEKKYHSRETLSRADSNYNERFLSGLEKNGIDVLTLNYMPFGSFPRSSVLFFNRQKWSDSGMRRAIHIGYINFIGIKYLTLTRNYIKELKKYVREENDVYILIYDCYLPFLWAVNYIKRRNPEIRTSMIVPSIPIYDRAGAHWKEKLMQKFARMKMKEADQIDSYVFLTEQMRSILNVTDKPYVVVEGIVPDKAEAIHEDLELSESGEWNLLYSGRLDRIYNIENLIDAVLETREKPVTLSLCGNGDLSEKIKKIADKEPRIKYLGFLSPNELSAARNCASILINPRTADGEYTKYSFPSKTMEYLAASKPVIAFKLPGIPEEYDDYIYYIPENSVSSIRKTILNVIQEIEGGQVKDRVERAKRFVEEQKNSKAQTKKIINMFLRMKYEKKMD